MARKPEPNHHQPLQRLTYRPAEAAEVMGIGVSTVYELMSSGRLHAIHLSDRLTLIHVDDIRAMFTSAA